jgi:hypothetical protein
MKKTLLALASAAMLAVPTAAAAATLPVTVTVSGKTQASWNQPKAYGYQDCFNKYWGEHHAFKKFEFGAKARGHLQTLGGGLAFFVWRGAYRGGASFLDPNASMTQTYDGLKGSDPGDCGGGRPVEVLKGRDCGSKATPADLDVIVENGEVRISAYQAKPVNFDCGPTWTSCFGAVSLEKVYEKFPLKRLRAKRPKTVEIVANEKCSDETTRGNVKQTRGGSVSWRITIQPEGRWKRF